MGDFSRDSNDPRKHYSGVLQQQGRVQLDADWNEQLAIQLHRTETEAVDVIGRCGAPKEGGGFLIGLTPNALDLTISAGRIYVEGLLCELDSTPVPVAFVSNTTNKVTVESLYADGAEFRKGQWVEISAAQKTGKQVLRIVGADAEAGTLTFDANVSNFKNAGAASIRRVTTLLTQPDYPGAAFTAPFDIAAAGQPPGASASPPKSPLTSPLTSPPKGDGLYLAYLDAWKREVTALDDPHLREVALGGPDTATRLKNVWQVKLLPVRPTGPPSTATPGAQPASPPDCESQFAEWDKLTAQPTGLLNARTAPPQDLKDPCLLPPTAGYTRLENQLYRVEVQRGGDRQTATFKWSRDNAVVRTSITDASKAASGILVVADVGRDEVLSFAGGQWVEITDEESVLGGKPRRLVLIDKVDPTTREITLAAPPADSLAGKTNLQLVRWDQTGDAATADGVAMKGGWLDLEAGVQVSFSEGTYRAGDLWLIPARTATGEIEWPPFAVPNADPAPQPPLGVRHHFCRLALVEIKGGIINLTDCRDLFPPLTHICAEDVCYDDAACDLGGADNVQDALEELCLRTQKDPGIHVLGVDLVKGTGLRHDSNVTVAALVDGIKVKFDQDVFESSVKDQPTCYLTLYLPFPASGQERAFWSPGNYSVFARQPVVLLAKTSVEGSAVYWTPAAETKQWLTQHLFQVLDSLPNIDRLLAVLTLKGNFIWAKNNPNLYLDGEVFGFQSVASSVSQGPSGPVTSTSITPGLRFPSGDGRRGGDFEMWFWLIEPLTARLAVTPTAVTAGNKATGTITLSGPAPTGGLVFKVDALDTRVPDPPPVNFPAGATAANFILSTPLNFMPTASVNVEVSSGEMKAAAPLLVNALALTVFINPAFVSGLGTTAGVVTLNQPAPDGGVQVKLTAVQATAVTITPATFTIPKGSTNFQFSVKANIAPKNATQVTIKAALVALPGVSDQKVLEISATPQ